MALAAPAQKMTAQEFFASTDELPHAQLIDGELVVNSPAFRHNRLIIRMVELFATHRATHPGAGEVGISGDAVLDQFNVYVPDLWWVPDDRRPDDGESRFVAPPPLVVEVRSPSTWRYDIGTKLRHYESSGVAEVWLVDTAADVVLVYRRRTPETPIFDIALELTTDDTLTTPLVPGWVIDLASIFAR